MTVMTAIRSAETEEARSVADRIARGARPAAPGCTAACRFFDALYAGAMPDDVLRARADQSGGAGHGGAWRKPRKRAARRDPCRGAGPGP